MTDPDTDPEFGNADLSVAERRLVQAAADGGCVDVRSGDAQVDDPAHAHTWGPDRQVRADLLVDLLTGERTPESRRPRAVKLRGARIRGALDLVAAELVCPLLLADCHLDEPVRLDEATAMAIRLPGCRLPALLADQLRTTGNLELDRGFAAERISLVGAGVGGVLSLAGAVLTNPGGRAITADGLTVEQSMFCGDGFTAHGEVHLRGATVNGTLHLAGAHLDAPGADALAAARLSVGHDTFCTDLSVNGEVRLPGARIGGRLDLTRARLADPGGAALTADRLAVGDGVLAEGLTTDGEVRLPGARIDGALVLAGAHLSNPGGRALNGDGLVVEQDFHAPDGFTAEGEVRLVRARVGGALNLDGAVLTNPDRTALLADALTAEQSIFCRGSAAEGEVRLIGARIGGVANFTGARLTNPGRLALYAVRLTVDGDLMCRGGFVAEGELRLSGARVGGHIELTDATLTKAHRNALDLSAVTAQELVLLPRRAPDGLVNLTNTQVGGFEDDRRTWPAALLLQGFTYGTLTGDHVDVRARLRWAARHDGGYTPQIYDQLAAAYQRTGHEEAARKVAIAKQWHRRKVLSPPGKLTNWLLYLTVGYGYRTWLAAIWLAGLLVLGTQLFASGQMTRTGTTAPAFNAFAYTLDVLLPIGDLGQQKSWQARGSALYWSWAFIAAGWVLSTAVVAGLTGILRRN